MRGCWLRSLLLLLCGLPLLCGGCVERRFTVVSNPPGAMVLVDRQEVGAAPITLPTRMSTYYGDREFLLIKDGYEPLLVKQPIPAPWFGYFPLDFVAEHLIPWTITDERVFTYQLAPKRVVPAETVLQSATGMRQRAAGIGGPLADLPGGVPPPLNPLPAGALPASPVVAPPAANPTGTTTAQPARVDFN